MCSVWSLIDSSIKFNFCAWKLSLRKNRTLSTIHLIRLISGFLRNIFTCFQSYYEKRRGPILVTHHGFLEVGKPQCSAPC